MAAEIRNRITFANVVSLIALFVALGGTSVAAVTLKKNSVRSKHIRNGQVQSVDVKDASLRAQDFGPSQLPAGPEGPRGPQGADGAAGQPGADAVLKRTRLEYFTGGTDTTVTTDYESLKTVGSFVKDSADTNLKVTWISHMRTTGADEFCDLQLRIDGAEIDRASRAVLYANGTNDSVENAPIHLTAVATGVPAGTHNLSVWVRGNADSCEENHNGFVRLAYVEEGP